MMHFVHILILILSVVQVSGQTVFEIGDLAIVGLNANNNLCEVPNSGADLVSFVIFEDLTTGTTLDFTDNGWERLYAGFWGTTEGVVRLTRTGGTIPAGTVITVRLDNTTITGVSPDAAWTSTTLFGINLNLNQNGDQLFIMQGGNFTTTGTHLGSYSGTVLFGFSSSGTWQTFTGSNLGAGGSAMYPGLPCFNMAPTSTSDWSKFTGPLTPTTKRVWLDRIRDSANWSPFADCASYNSGAPVYQTGFTISITGGGFNPGYWLGIEDEDWFDCVNWENLLVPGANTDVLLRPLDLSEGPFTHAEIDATGALCRSIHIMAGAELNIESLGELEVFTELKNNGLLNSTGTISLEGNQPGILSGSSGISTRHLVLNKTGGSAIQADTLVTITTNGSLTFNSGVLTPTSPNRLDFESGSMAINTSNASFVNGPVRKFGDQNFNFPVGDDGFYQPIGIENISPVNSSYEARFFNANGPGIYGYSWVPSINNVATCNYWTLDQISGTSARVRLSWGNDDDCEINNLAGLVVSRHDGAIWQNEGQLSTTGNTVNGSVLSANVITDFSPFALASITGDNPLPVEWLNFSVQAENDGVKLKWSTASEINNDYFEIEHSTDGFEFVRVGQIEGSGNSSTMNSYRWFHSFPMEGSNYYRIRQVDFDGTADYSSIQHVKITGTGSLQLVVNPPELRFSLSQRAQNVQAQLLNTTGQPVFSTRLEPGDRFVLNSGHLARGMYILRVVADGQVFTEKLIY